MRFESDTAASAATAPADGGWWAELRTPLRDAAAAAQQRLDRARYRAQQYAIATPIGVVRRAVSLLTGEPAPDGRSVAALRARYEDLLARDLANVEAGLYPRALLFQIPFG